MPYFIYIKTQDEKTEILQSILVTYNCVYGLYKRLASKLSDCLFFNSQQGIIKKVKIVEVTVQFKVLSGFYVQHA